jgi:hypothetical protein
MSFLFVTVFVDMLGYGLLVPLLPFYAGGLANGALLVGALGSLYAAMQFLLHGQGGRGASHHHAPHGSPRQQIADRRRRLVASTPPTAR